MKKWTENEINQCVEYINDGLSYVEISKKINRTKQSVRIKLNSLNIFSKPKKYDIELKCKNCGRTFISLISENRKFCDSSCAAVFNNKKHIKKTKQNKEYINKKTTINKKCINCEKEIIGHKKFCNSFCFQEHRKKERHQLIENGDKSLTNRAYKLYLIDKFGNKCMNCGWGIKNEYTNTIPIELEHIDGNGENNSLENLKLLCPNCHSLTPTYKGANVGNGRHKRRIRYKEGKSY